MAKILYCPNCGNKLIEAAIYCPNCGNKVSGNKSNSKKERVINYRNNHGKNNLYIVVILIIFVGAIFYYIKSQPSKELEIIEKQPKVADNISYPPTRYDHAYTIAFTKNNKIILPLNLVKERKFVRFQVVGNNESAVPILAYLTEDGKVVTAISMCEPCNSTEFHIEGNNLICNSCGTTWNLNDLNAVSGSCGRYPPDPIPSKVVGNEIQIDEYLVKNWSRRI